MSHHFRELREGDYLPVKGPMVHILSFGECPLVKQCNTYTWMLVSDTDNSMEIQIECLELSVMYMGLTPSSW